MNRRQYLHGLALGVTALAAYPLLARGAGMPGTTRDDAGCRRLEREFGVSLAVAAIDLAGGRRWNHRAHERVALCSTFKLLLAAAVLAQVDAGKEQLQRRVVFDADALLDYAPVTRRHVGPPGMTIADLCEAAVTLSDNTAANLLLSRMDGPAGLTRWLRTIGDSTSRLDRPEPGLNDVVQGDPRDTTTAAAMLDDLQCLLVGEVLSSASRSILLRWLADCRTGDKRLRAGVPDNWQAGDKTGSGADTSSDVAIFRPPGRAPLLIAAYCSGGDTESRDHALASVARHIADAVRSRRRV